MLVLGFGPGQVRNEQERESEGVRGVYILHTLKSSRWAMVIRTLREIARIHRTPDNPGESPDYPDPVHNLSQACFFVEI